MPRGRGLQAQAEGLRRHALERRRQSTHPDINVAGVATESYAALVCTTPGSRDKVSVRRSTFRLA